MKKNIFLFVACCICLTGCGSNKENYAAVETAYHNLIEKTDLSYEFSMLYEGEAAQTYVVEEAGDEWNYSLYIGEDTLLQECKYENGVNYIRIADGKWSEQSNEQSLTFLDDMLVDADKIADFTMSENDNGITEVSITLNESALSEATEELRESLKAAVIELENSGASEAAIEAQKVHNEILEQTTYRKDERAYVIDENDVLIGYSRTVIYEQPDEDGNMEEQEYVSTMSVTDYQ